MRLTGCVFVLPAGNVFFSLRQTDPPAGFIRQQAHVPCGADTHLETLTFYFSVFVSTNFQLMSS